MKKEQLLKKLENVELPELLVASHKAKLKQVLLEGVPSTGEVDADTVLERIASSLKASVSWLSGPAWRTALASGLSILFIGALLAVSFYISRPSPAAIAADVVKNDPGIQQRLSGAGDIIIVRVEVRDGMASVVCGRSMGDFIEADVDIQCKSVVNTRRYEGLFIPEMPLQSQDSAVKIAIADPTVKTMLNKGGNVGKVFPIFSAITSITIDGNLVKVTPAATQAVVPIYLNGKAWLVQVNLEEQKIERIIEPQSGSSNYFDIYYLLKQI